MAIEWVAPADALPPQAEPGLVDGIDELPRTLVVRTAASGDFSRYTLAIVAELRQRRSARGLRSDALAASTSPSRSSARRTSTALRRCPARRRRSPAPRIDYLAKDYAGFRRLMLDRLSLLVPGWTERSAADLGVTLVELLAFAADTLSYRQDVVANEAYLNTARQRVSVRRHARLVDYYLHEGCNARAFVHFKVLRGASPQFLPHGTRDCSPRAADASDGDRARQRDEREALAAGVLVFETAHEVDARTTQSTSCDFYTWGDKGCCLPRGALTRDARGSPRGLKAGDFLVFQEVRSPTTRSSDADADRAHRHVVRLTRVTAGRRSVGSPVRRAADRWAVPITDIEWDASDALPFALCISAPRTAGLE